MQPSLEFILGLLDRRFPAVASTEDFAGAHGRTLHLWQRRGFLAREPEGQPASSCPRCREGVPHRLGGRLLCDVCHSPVDERHMLRWRFDLDAFLEWLALGLKLKDDVCRVDDHLWRLGSRSLGEHRYDCFFLRGGTVSTLGRQRLLAHRHALLVSCVPAAPLDRFSGHCLSLFDLLRQEKGSLKVADLARVLHGGSAVRFDGTSGALWAGDAVLGHVPLDSKEYHFLSYLSRHLGEFAAYADIKHHVIQKTGSGDTTEEATFCQRLKSRIKKRVPSIDDLIATTNKGRGYLMRDHLVGRGEA